MSGCMRPADGGDDEGSSNRSTQASWPLAPGIFCGDDAQLMTAIVPLGLVLFAYALLVYLCLYRGCRGSFYYQLRRHCEALPPYDASRGQPSSGWKGPAAPSGAWDFFGGLGVSSRLSDESFVGAAGLDALSHLLSLRLYVRLLVCFAPWGAILVGLYVYYFHTTKDKKEYGYRVGLDRATLAVIKVNPGDAGYEVAKQ